MRLSVGGVSFYLDPYADGIYLWNPSSTKWWEWWERVVSPLSHPCVIGDMGSFGALMAMNIASAYHPLLSKE